MSAESTQSQNRGDEKLEVAVIGAGQAALAMGYFLRRQGRRFVILERADHIAPAWRERCRLTRDKRFASTREG